MHIIHKFPDSEQQKLSRLFPDIDKVVSSRSSNAYKCMAVSVYDHWLAEEDISRRLSDVPFEEQRSREAKFTEFSKKIVENTEVINFTMLGRRSKPQPVFRKFLSKTAKLQYMKNAVNPVSNNDFFRVALPDLEALYFESWDDTNIFYLRNPKSADIIESWANESGLYRLDYS